MIASIFTPQIVFDGAVNGLIYGLVGMGIVLVYRSTRVINFAVGSMGLLGAAIFALLNLEYGVPFWLALALALVAGTASGTVIELIVIRRLFTAPRVIVLVATIGVSQVALAATMSLPEITNSTLAYPRAFSHDLMVGSVKVSGADLLVLLVVPALALALGYVLTRTPFGRRVSASADNPDLARLSGVSPKIASTLVWTISGFVATVSLVLVAGRVGNVAAVATLGPGTLTRGLIVAVIAGLASFPRALLAGLAVGVIEAVVGFNSLSTPGLVDSLLLIAVLIAVFVQSRSQAGADGAVFSFAPRARPIPPAIAQRWWVKHHGRIIFVLALTMAAGVPLIVSTPSSIYLYATILCFAMAAMSVSIITGWSGQLSLGQMAFAGIGALGTAALVRGTSIDIGLPGSKYLHVASEPLTLPFALVVMSLVTAVVAAIIGLGALRVRGLLLGVSTFVFAYAAQQYLFGLDIFTGGTPPPVRLPRGSFAGFDLTNQRTYYWLVLIVLALVVSVVARLRRRGPGRTMVAVRDNPDTAAAYTVPLARTRLAGYTLSGAIAGLAGGLLGGLTQNINTNQLFVVGDSLAVVSMAVIGGLGSVAGPIIGALWVKGLPALFPGNDLVPLFSSGIGMLVLLLYVPGGLVQVAYSTRDAVFAWVARRAPEPVRTPRPAIPARTRTRTNDLATNGPVLVAHDVVVSFGGITAVDAVSLRLDHGEIVGLIGTNGAGKSTLLNAIGGYVPSRGKVEVLGHDVSGLSAHRRARVGLGRTFQAATLFPELTVNDTVMVALEARGRSRLLSTALAIPTAGRAERHKAAEASEIIDFLGLGAFANSFIADLSTGTRRIVELAGLIAVDARVMCLDEPTAGVAQRETEAFGPLIVAIKDELDASVLIIEHDMPLIMSMSDRVYCLDAGRVIAEGAPDDVRANPEVIASYLGTDVRAINRSDATRSEVPA